MTHLWKGALVRSFHQLQTSLRNQWLGCLHIAKLGLRAVLTVAWGVQANHYQTTAPVNVKHQRAYWMREEDAETGIAACVHQINTAILQNTKRKTVQLGPKRTAGSAGEKLKRKSPRQPGNRTSTLKRVTASLQGPARSLSFSYPNVVEYFQCLITRILCGKRKDSLYGKMCPRSLLEQCASNWKNQCPSHRFFSLWRGLRP